MNDDDIKECMGEDATFHKLTPLIFSYNAIIFFDSWSANCEWFHRVIAWDFL